MDFTAFGKFQQEKAFYYLLNSFDAVNFHLLFTVKMSQNPDPDYKSPRKTDPKCHFVRVNNAQLLKIHFL